MGIMTLTHAETLAAIEANDPPIQVNQVWSIRSDKPEYVIFKGVVRADRILAVHPDPGVDGRERFIYEPAKVRMSLKGDGIGVRNEYNLRRTFQLDVELTAALVAQGGSDPR